MNKKGSTLALTVVIVAVVIIITYSVFASLKFSARIKDRNDVGKENLEIADMASNDLLAICNITANYILEEIIKKSESGSEFTAEEANKIYTDMIVSHISKNAKYTPTNKYYLVNETSIIDQGTLQVEVSVVRGSDSDNYYYFRTSAVFQRDNLTSRVKTNIKVKKNIFISAIAKSEDASEAYKLELVATRDSWEEY